MTRMRVLWGAVLTLALCAAATLHAQTAARPMRVLVALRDGAVEADYTAFGATVQERWSNYRVLAIDRDALARLTGDPAVSYVQHIEGEPPLTIDADKPPAATKLGDPAVTATPPTWYSGEYRYDAAGNITAIGATSALYPDGKPTLNGHGKSNAYGYDSAGRLVRATANNTAEGSESYRYDSFGNLVERTRDTSAQSVTSQISVSLATNRVNGASYDAAGNLTNWPVTGETYDYDAANMVVAKRASATSAAEVYLYTADDERIATRRTDSTWRWTVRDVDGKVLREYESASDSPTATWAWVEDYVYRDGALFAATRPLAQGGTRHFHLDHLGTPRLISGANGLAIAVHDYFPYGSEQTTFNQEMTNRGYDRPEPMTFTGHERDYTEGTAVPSENFVDSMHARYYRAAWGRFLSVDPALDVKQAMKNPQGWNRYAYVFNNPMRFTDPTGKYACSGSKEDCAAIEAAIQRIRTAAQEYTKAHKPGMTALNAAAAFFGKANERNGVMISTADLGPLATAKTKNLPFGNTLIEVDKEAISFARQNREDAVELSAALAHESDHGTRGFKLFMSRDALLGFEKSAYTTQGYINEFYGVRSTWNVWSDAWGWDRQAIDKAAQGSVDAALPSWWP